MSNNQWRGTISQFYPGYGYMYKSNRTMPVMVTFTGQQPAPQVIVTTTEPTDITTNSATCGGNVASSDGNYVFVILRGICWSTNPNPTFNDNYVEVGDGLGSFSASMTELAPSTSYYVRAFAVTANGTFYGEEMSFITLNVPTGAIDGLFSVSSTQQVYFSQGNLQYIGSASTPYWKFADHQWDYLGTTTGQNSDSENVDRDLFGWGTSGYNHGGLCWQPWSTSENYSNYFIGGYSNVPIGGQSDWGYNAIVNGNNSNALWHTLSRQQWDYLMDERNTPSGIRYACSIVNGVQGLLVLPDDWNSQLYSLLNANSFVSPFDANTISVGEWNNIFEPNGAVFLPCSGRRSGTEVSYVGSEGCYWSTTPIPSLYQGRCAYYVEFNNGSKFGGFASRYIGCSVRLVQDYQP